MNLDEILKEQKLNGGTHDGLIKRIKHDNSRNPNLIHMYSNAYYKIGKYEGDIDLLQMMFNSRKYNDIDNFRDISSNDAKLLLFEMKSCHSRENEHKAIKQLKKSKSLIIDYSPYYDITTFYCFGVGKSYCWNQMEV